MLLAAAASSGPTSGESAGVRRASATLTCQRSRALASSYAWAACHGFASLLVGGVLANRPEFPGTKALREALADQVATGARRCYRA